MRRYFANGRETFCSCKNHTGTPKSLLVFHSLRLWIDIDREVLADILARCWSIFFPLSTINGPTSRIAIADGFFKIHYTRIYGVADRVLAQYSDFNKRTTSYSSL